MKKSGFYITMILVFACFGFVVRDFSKLFSLSQNAKIDLNVCSSINNKNGEIVVGSALPLKKEGKFIEQGLDVAFRRINKTGGISGKLLRLIPFNDRKNIARAVSQIVASTLPSAEYLRTPLFINLFTPGVVSALLPLIKDEKILIFGPEENLDELQKPEYKFLLHTKPSIKKELDAVVFYAINSLRKRRFGVFFVDDDYGIKGRDCLREVLGKYNLRLVSEGSYTPKTLNIEDAVEDVRKGHPDAIVSMARRHATYNFVLLMVNRGLVKSAFLGTSYLLPIQSYLQKARGIRFTATSTVPNPIKSSLSIVKEYREDLRRINLDEPFSTISLFAYLNGRLFGEILGRVKGDITKEKIVKSAESIRYLNLGGMLINFNANNRTLSENLWVSPGVDDDWLDMTEKIMGKVVSKEERIEKVIEKIEEKGESAEGAI